MNGHETIRQGGMKPVYRLGWHFFRFVLATYFRWRVYTPERMPAEGPVIVAGNHASYIDPPVIGAGVRRELHYLTRDTSFRFPVFGALLRRWNCVPVDPKGGSSAGLKAILDRLQAGNAVIVFPEGTRSRDGRLQPPRSGIGLLVIKSEAPVIPVRLFGTYEAYSRSMLIPRPRRLQVKYGRPMTFEALRREARSCSKARLKEVYQEISRQVMEAISAMEPGGD